MTPPFRAFALQDKGSIIIIDELLSGCHKVFLTFFIIPDGINSFLFHPPVYGQESSPTLICRR